MMTEIRFRNGKVGVEIADNIISRSLGLSFRKEIKGNEGMLFRFSRATRALFWNFGMLFPIDVLWIRDGEIVGIEENIPKMMKGIKVFAPEEPVHMAIELSSGSVKRLGIMIHDRIIGVA
jgi:hypothetical protein